MVTLKTKTPFNLVDDRQKSIGEHIIYLKADELVINNELVTLHGYYYYEKETISGEEENLVVDTQVIVLSRFSQKFLWDTIQGIETVLQPLDTVNLKEAINQRIVEFTFLQLQMESGENFKTVDTDWEVV